MVVCCIILLSCLLQSVPVDLVPQDICSTKVIGEGSSCASEMSQNLHSPSLETQSISSTTSVVEQKHISAKIEPKDYSSASLESHYSENVTVKIQNSSSASIELQDSKSVNLKSQDSNNASVEHQDSAGLNVKVLNSDSANAESHDSVSVSVDLHDYKNANTELQDSVGISLETLDSNSGKHTSQDSVSVTVESQDSVNDSIQAQDSSNDTNKLQDSSNNTDKLQDSSNDTDKFQDSSSDTDKVQDRVNGTTDLPNPYTEPSDTDNLNPRMWWNWRATPRPPVVIPNDCGQVVTSRIVGGMDSMMHEWPWAVSLRVLRHTICGGSLVTSRHVITAAHCVKFYTYLKFLIYVVVGGHTRTDGKELSVDKITLHENFGNKKNLDNDLAIITLTEDQEFDISVSPICLPPTGTKPLPEDAALTVVGWGYIKEKGPKTDVLQEVTIKLLPPSACSSYGELWTDNMLCGRAPGKDACTGDSGGPLMTHVGGAWHLVGIVSFGKGCGRPDYPGVYTRLTNYLDWILSVIQQ